MTAGASRESESGAISRERECGEWVVVVRSVCVCVIDDRSAGLSLLALSWAAGAAVGQCPSVLVSAALLATALAQAQFGVSSNNSPPGHPSAGEASMAGAAVGASAVFGMAGAATPRLHPPMTAMGLTVGSSFQVVLWLWLESISISCILFNTVSRGVRCDWSIGRLETLRQPRHPWTG